ncbi:RagB/SusD family nutrient uptake outer membrane protein [Candidatus Poribacteria bacterium]|nr:RagB/SusD family nutrient uptake outer membrane protein [Candidatus Poribacteria bacterium]
MRRFRNITQLAGHQQINKKNIMKFVRRERCFELIFQCVRFYDLHSS